MNRRTEGWIAGLQLVALRPVLGSGMVPGLVTISALLLTFSPDETQMNSLVTSFMIGEPLFSWLPLIATVVFCATFIGAAIWCFTRQEFLGLSAQPSNPDGARCRYLANGQLILDGHETRRVRR